LPKKIQEATTALKLIKKFALVGAFTPQLDESIVPVVIMDDLVDAEEWRFAFLHHLRVAVAAEFNSWELSNPAGSGKVLQLMQINFANSSGLARFQVHVNDVNPDLPQLLVAQFQELEEIVLAADEFPVGQVREDGLLANFTGPEAFGAQVIQDTIITWRPENMLLYPGVRVFFQQRVVNQNGDFSIQWRERALRPDGT